MQALFMYMSGIKTRVVHQCHATIDGALHRGGIPPLTLPSQHGICRHSQSCCGLTQITNNPAVMLYKNRVVSNNVYSHKDRHR